MYNPMTKVKNCEYDLLEMSCIKKERCEDVGDFEKENYLFGRENDENIQDSIFQRENMEDNCDVHKRALKKYNNTSTHVKKEIFFDHVEVNDVASFVEKNRTINQSLICVKEEIDVKYHELEINEGLIFPCMYCELMFSSPLYQAKHEEFCKKNKHSDSDRKYMCEERGMKFKTKEHMNKHEVTHTGERLFICDLCNKRFTLKNSLYRHVNTVHNREKKFQCDVCNKKFSHSYHLITHKRTHSKVKPFCCDVCNKTFTQSSHLTKHMRVHTGERPYSCNICTETFTQSSHLIRHVRVHTGERPYSCTFCDMKFAHSPSMKTHIKTKHGQH